MMMIFRILLPLIVLAVLGPSAVASLAPGEDFTSPKVRVELLSDVTAIEPGGTFWIGLHQQIDPGWHTYWRNPGDSGAPTTLSLELPAGFSVSELQWPIPERIPYGPLLNFGYHDEVLLLQQVSVPADWRGDSLTLAGKADWLVCADICIPESADVDLTLPVQDADPAVALLFERTRQQLPRSMDVAVTQSVAGEEILLQIEMAGLSGGRIDTVTFFPFIEGLMDNPAPQSFSISPAGLRLKLVAGYDFTPDRVLAGVVVVEEVVGGNRLRTAFEISPQLDVSTQATAGISLVTVLALAFLGGVILNLMPCVFPVLSIKILSLLEHRPASSRTHGWVYVAGVVLSFVAIAAVLLSLRAGGEQIGWGFQLQSTVVVSLLVYLFFLIGLNLLGQFELGTGIMGFGSSLTLRHDYVGSFFTGVLATVVAAPCTVPFMATAVGYAMTQPAQTAVSVFAMLGVGMATPYLLLCYSPRLMSRLPRPGPWMVRFREVLSFPMFATAAWLTWVLTQQAGSAGVLVIGSGLVALAFVVWLLRHLPAAGPVRTGLQLIALLTVAGTLWMAVSLPGQVPEGAAPGAVERAGYLGPRSAPWSAEALAAAREQGPVFVNFTAAWCITCKVNEAVALNSAAVRAAFERGGITYLKADWTNEDPEITRALAEYQRSGVPLYLFYRAGEDRAHVLPQLLTESLLLDALEAR